MASIYLFLHVLVYHWMLILYGFADRIYWPVFIVATLVAVVASPTIITTTFSIIKQALALKCFPRAKVVYTSKKFLG